MERSQAQMGTVLVTGGSGFLGGWCLVELLRRGYRVRTTVRDLSREPEVRAMLASEVDAGDRLSVVAGDLRRDDGWEQAVEGCDCILHVASPFPPAQPKDPDELIVPAREGTLRVLGAGLEAGVSRVVVTSSVAAIRNGGVELPSAPLTEEDWTDPANLNLTPYTRSKTIAERSAWELVRERGEVEKLAVVNPGAILGPVLSDDRSYSLEAIERLLKGMPGVPRIGFSFVDVRDVADLHVTADERSRGRRRALHRGGAVPVDVGGRRGPARPSRRGSREGTQAHRAEPDRARDGDLRSGDPLCGGRSRQEGGAVEREGQGPSRVVASPGRGDDRRLRAEPDARGRGRSHGRAAGRGARRVTGAQSRFARGAVAAAPSRPSMRKADGGCENRCITERYQRPGWFTKHIFNRAVAGLTRVGVSVAGSRVLEIRGRKTGQPRRTPVNLLTLEGARYLVAPRGHTQWVRNLRAQGEGRLLLGRRAEQFTASELADDDKPAVLRAYLKRWKWEVGVFFEGVGPDATDDELRRIAPDHPIFRISPPAR